MYEPRLKSTRPGLLARSRTDDEARMALTQEVAMIYGYEGVVVVVAVEDRVVDGL